MNLLKIINKEECFIIKTKVIWKMFYKEYKNRHIQGVCF